MDLPPPLDVLHQPVRLRVVALLARHRDVAVTQVRDLLRLTDGNLAAHVRRLEEAGLAVARRVPVHGRFEARLRITPAGDAAFRQYLAALRRFLEDEATGGPGPGGARGPPPG